MMNHYNTPTPFIDHCVQRLLIERDYRLLADVAEQDINLPDEDRWVRALDEANDETATDALLEQLCAAIDTHESTWEPVGGPFRQLQLPEGEGEETFTQPVASPPLLELKDYAHRILIKNTLNALRVMLVIKESALGSIDRTVLLNAGEALSRWHAAQSIEADGNPGKKIQRMPVLVEVVLAGEQVASTSNRQSLKKLVKRFSPRQKVFVRCAIVDCATDEVWSSSRFPAAHCRRYFRHALANRQQSAEDIRKAVENLPLNIPLVLFGVLTGFVAFLACRLALVSHDVTDRKLMFLLADYIAPLTAFCIVLSLSRLRQKAYLQARWMFGGYLVLYAGFHLLFIWPPGLGLMLSLVAAGTLLWVTLSFAALAMAWD